MENKKERNYSKNVEIKKGSNNLDDFVINTPKMGNEIRGSGQNINTSLEEFAEDASKINKEISKSLEDKSKELFNKTKNKFEEFASDTTSKLKKISENIADKTKDTINKIIKK